MMAQAVSAGRIRVMVAQMAVKSGVELDALYHALGADPAAADKEAVAHLAGIIDGMEAAARAIRDQGLEGWPRP